MIQHFCPISKVHSFFSDRQHTVEMHNLFALASMLLFITLNVCSTLVPNKILRQVLITGLRAG